MNFAPGPSWQMPRLQDRSGMGKAAPSLQLPALFAHRLRIERQIHSILDDALLALAAQDVGQEFLDPRRDRFAGWTVDVDVDSIAERIGAPVHRFACGRDVGTAIARGDGERLYPRFLL